MAKRTKELGLGRGLNALLGDPDLQAQGEGSVSLPISQVQPGLNQPRKRFDQDARSGRVYPGPRYHPAADSAPSVLRLLPDHCR